MTQTVQPTPAGILGIDLGKFKSVACLLGDDGELVFQTFATDCGALTAILERDRPRVVAVEACTPAGWVSDLCGELGVSAHRERSPSYNSKSGTGTCTSCR